MVAPGVTTAELDALAERADARGGRGAGVQGVSRLSGDALRVGQRGGGARHPVGDAALDEGDIVSIDMGVKLDGFFGDSAVTVPVGHGVARTRRRCCGSREEALVHGDRRR